MSAGAGPCGGCGACGAGSCSCCPAAAAELGADAAGLLGSRSKGHAKDMMLEAAHVPYVCLYTFLAVCGMLVRSMLHACVQYSRLCSTHFLDGSLLRFACVGLSCLGRGEDDRLRLRFAALTGMGVVSRVGVGTSWYPSGGHAGGGCGAASAAAAGPSGGTAAGCRAGLSGAAAAAGPPG